MPADTFRPAPWLPGRHLQTIVPSLWPAPPVPGRHEQRIVPVADGSALRVEIDRPECGARATLVLVHGMGGSAESSYMRRTATLAVASGSVTVRVNLRNCGGTEHLATTLYNAGQSGDVGRVIAMLDGERFPRPFRVAGFSLGGNIVLRWAGTEGAAASADAVAAVNPPIDLAACVRAIERPANRLYQRHYVRGLCGLLRRIARLRSVPAPVLGPRRVRTVRRFDERYTAPDAGYAGAEEYYAEASAGPRLGGLRRPTLVVSAADDPFVPTAIFAPHHGRPGLELLHPARGGHCGYWQAGPVRFWAGQAMLEFFEGSA